jgi:hypothetical protein
MSAKRTNKSGLCFETGTCKVSERPRLSGGKRALFEFTLLRERVCAVEGTTRSRSLRNSSRELSLLRFFRGERNEVPSA